MQKINYQAVNSFKNVPGGVTKNQRAMFNSLLFRILWFKNRGKIHSNFIFEPVSFKFHSAK